MSCYESVEIAREFLPGKSSVGKQNKKGGKPVAG